MRKWTGDWLKVAANSLQFSVTERMHSTGLKGLLILLPAVWIWVPFTFADLQFPDLLKMEENNFHYAYLRLICWIIEKAREFQKNVYFCFIDYAKAFDCVDHNELWKILQDMGIPDHLPCLLRNLYAGQEAMVRTGHGTTDWFQIRKGVHQGSILSPCLFNLYAEFIMLNASLDKAQAGIKIARRNINNLMQMTLPLWQKVKRN